MPDYTDPDTALAAAQRAIKGVEGESADEAPELQELLELSAGKLGDEDWQRPFYAAADYLFSDPDRIVKAKNGVTFAQLVDAVVTLLERQVRVDATEGVTVPAAWSAQTALDRVLERSGKAPAKPRRATLHAL